MLANLANLAIECGNLDVAVEMARQLDRPKLYQRLATEALAHGNHQITELAYQKLRSFDRLSFLYLATGDKAKLTRSIFTLANILALNRKLINSAVEKIAEHRGDMTVRKFIREQT
jgi:coatomer protein complex subunit alpha (xenin)